jgi:hypothetical protein
MKSLYSGAEAAEASVETALDSSASILGTASGDATPAASPGAAASVFVCDGALISWTGRSGIDWIVISSRGFCSTLVSGGAVSAGIVVGVVVCINGLTCGASTSWSIEPTGAILECAEDGVVSSWIAEFGARSVDRIVSDGAARERTGLAEPVAALSVVCCVGFPSERKYQHLR